MLNNPNFILTDLPYTDLKISGDIATHWKNSATARLQLYFKQKTLTGTCLLAWFCPNLEFILLFITVYILLQERLLFTVVLLLFAKLSSSWQFQWKLSWVSSIITVAVVRPDLEKYQQSIFEQNLLSNICGTTPVESKTILKNLKIWKTTSMEDDLTGRWPK